MKFVLRYLITKNSNINWVEILSTLQTQLNNAFNVIINRSFNEMIYEFKLRDVLIVLIRKFIKIDDINFERFRHQRKAIDVTLYVMIKIKIVYDSRHTFLLFKSNDKAFLRLHKRYTLFNKFNAKLFNQRVDSFFVKRRIKCLIYELNLSSRWQIHLVIFVIQLKSISLEKNFYQRLKFDFSNEIEIEKMFNIEFEKNFEIEIIIDKRLRIFNKITITQYLIRWKDWNSIYDEWKNIVKLIESIDLVENYERQHFDNDELHQFFNESFRRSKKFVVDKNLITTKKIIVIQQLESSIKLVKHRRRFEKKVVITSLFTVITLVIFVVTKSIVIVTKSNRQFRSRKSHVSRTLINTSSSSSNSYYYQIDSYVNSRMNVKNQS